MVTAIQAALTTTFWEKNINVFHKTGVRLLKVLRYLWPAVVSPQSCHIGEEDEGGEQEGEEPSFEVRQTEMVWGDQGMGDRGVSGEATPHQWPHHDITLAHPPLQPQRFSPYSLPVVSLVHSHHLSIFLLWWTDLCMPLLDSGLQSDRRCRLNLFYFPKLHDLSAERRCS